MFTRVLFVFGVALFSVNAQAARSCLETAERGLFNHFQAQRLCAFSLTDAPAICGRIASRDWPTEHAVTLCQYAQDTFPVSCARDPSLRFLPISYIAVLCNQAVNMAPALCASGAATAHLFTNESLIHLCYGAVDLAPAVCSFQEYAKSRDPIKAVAACRAIQPQGQDNGGIFFPPGGGGGPIFNPPGGGGNPGGGGSGFFTSCTLTTAAGSYQGIGFTEGQATAAARDQCLQVESVTACNAGKAACHAG